MKRISPTREPFVANVQPLPLPTPPPPPPPPTPPPPTTPPTPRPHAPPRRRALGIVTATSDDALFASLDQGTKAAAADVVYARSFYAGSSYPSGPLSGECIGVYAAQDPAEVDAALEACLAYLESEAWFYAVETAEEPGRPVIFFPHVVASVGRYLAPLADAPVGSALAYLIAPPLESIVGLDAACKAAPTTLAKWFGPPSETNFGGGYLAGDQPACEAAARAFADAIVDVCRAPRGHGAATGVATATPEATPEATPALDPN